MSSRFRFRRRNTWSSGSRIRRRRGFGSSSLVKRARGNMRAANNQNDSSNVVINLMHSIYAGCSVGYGADTAANILDEYPLGKYNIGTTAVNIYDLLRKSDFFNSYAGMYDQFRINSIKVKVTPTQWSVFDQSRSTVNYIDSATGLAATNDSIINLYPPQPDDYILNPAFNEEGTEGIDNPMYIVPGVEPRAQNYVAIPVAADPDPYADYRAKGIHFLVNFRSDAGVPGAFPNGTVNNWAQSVISSVANSDYGLSEFIYPQALTVVTAWDRTGLSTAQYHNLDTEDGYFVVNDDSGRLEHFDDNDKSVYCCCIGDTITTYSSAQTKQLVGGASFNLIRYLYPSSQQEKSTFYSTSSLRDQLEKLSGISHYLYVPTGENSTLSEAELTNPLESPVVPFKPTFLIGVLGHNDITEKRMRYLNPDDMAGGNQRMTYNLKNLIKPVKFSLEFDIGVTFRGLRKTQVV